MSIISRIKSMFAGGGIRSPKPTSSPIGEVTHYFDKAGVAVIKFNKRVSVGTRIRIYGATTDFFETLGSMQLEHIAIDAAEPNQEVGVKVGQRAREGDKVFAL